MRTRTIYSAMSGAYRTILFTQTVDDFLHRKARQWATFERELLRRMDERDALVAREHTPPDIRITAIKISGKSASVDLPIGWKEFEI